MYILQLSEYYQCQRLKTVCEIYIAKTVESETAHQVEAAEIPLADLLNLASMMKANQLESFLLHFMSTNYSAIRKRKDFAHLSKEHREYVEKNQYPPLEFLERLKEYEEEKEKEENKKEDENSIFLSTFKDLVKIKTKKVEFFTMWKTIKKKI